MHRHLAITTAATLAALALPAGASAAKPPKPPSTTLTATATPAVVTWGTPARITGKAGGAGRDVSVQSTPFPYSDPFKTLGTATSGADGAYAFTVRPTLTTRYRARYRNATSAVVRVQVRPKVRFFVSDATPASGQRVRFYGRILPQHDGQKVLLQRRASDGTWRTQATTMTADVPGKDSSTYSKRLRIRRSGTWRARLLSGDFDHLNGTSRSLRLTVG